MQPIIKIVDVSKHFGKNQVLKDINLKITEGRILGLIGQSGSGKTTLLRTILGIYSPTKGDITIHGKKTTGTKPKEIGFASQEYSFYPRLTIEENLKFYGEMYKIPRNTLKSRISKLLALFELTKARKTKAQNISGGMKRRLDIAIAILHNPEIIILDEPTTGLDVVLREKIWGLLEKIRAEGMTIIVSSHDLEELQQHCTDIAFLRQGYIYDPQTLKEYQKQYPKATLQTIFKSWYIEEK